MSEEEHILPQVHYSGSDMVTILSSHYSVHMHVLQTFIKKIIVFCSVMNYVKTDHQSQVQADTADKSYRLAGLYD